jgi:APA family basic amino acid/polyamine antiporter
LSCITCMVAYQNHPNFRIVRHFFIPTFGLLANLACMTFYVVGPFMGYGTVKEPLLALGIAIVWGIYGAIYFVRSSRATGRRTLVESRT